MDIHLDTTAVSVRNGRGAITKRVVVPTSRSALRQSLRGIRGRARIICESGPLAMWVRDTLETRLREVVVCDRRRTRLTTSGAKTDRIDADRLSDLIRRDQVFAVHVPYGDAALLRRYAFHYARMLRERSRIIQRLRSLFFEHGIRVQTPRSTPERVPLTRLTAPGAKYVARAYKRQLENASALVSEARAELLYLAAQSPAFELLQTVPYVGEVRASELLAIVGDPSRFRSLRAFWSYGGLGVIQKLSSEHKLKTAELFERSVPAESAFESGSRSSRWCCGISHFMPRSAGVISALCSKLTLPEAKLRLSLGWHSPGRSPLSFLRSGEAVFLFQRLK
jgi:transposase